MTMDNRPLIDDIDFRIIRILQEDGRMSSRAIAQRIGHLTDRAVRYRIERLVRDRVIRIAAILDTETLGLGVAGDVLLRVEPKRARDIAIALAERQHVSYVATGGEGIISIQVNTTDACDLANYVTDMVNHVDGVLGRRILVVPDLIKDIPTWPPPHSLVRGSHRLVTTGGATTNDGSLAVDR